MTRPREFFDPCQLKVGSRIELEHTKSRAVAKRIAIDHLRETPDYYTQLCRWHKDAACKLFKRCKRRKRT